VLIGSETSNAAADRDQSTSNGVTPAASDLGDADESAHAGLDTPGGESTGRLSRRRPSWPWVAVGVVVVAVMVIELVLLLSARSQVSNLKALDHAETSALVAARQYATYVASYDYRTLNHDFGLVEAASTPTFRTQFQNSSGALKPVLTQYHAVAKAQVVAAGLESITTDRAVAAVFINQTVSNTTQKSGATTDQSRLELTLVQQHGKWLIDNLKLL
jgi:Mce-associated membrane protein